MSMHADSIVDIINNIYYKLSRWILDTELRNTDYTYTDFLSIFHLTNFPKMEGKL